jgi:hypothetical protein
MTRPISTQLGGHRRISRLKTNEQLLRYSQTCNWFMAVCSITAQSESFLYSSVFSCNEIRVQTAGTASLICDLRCSERLSLLVSLLEVLSVLQRQSSPSTLATFDADTAVFNPKAVRVHNPESVYGEHGGYILHYSRATNVGMAVRY